MEHSALERRRLGATFGAAFGFSACASASVVAERIAGGRSPLWWVFDLSVTLGAALLVHFSLRSIEVSTVPRTLTVSLFGLLFAMALVHVVSQSTLDRGVLVERPAQFVNDGVLSLALLGLIWSYVARSKVARALLPIPSFLLVSMYFLTKAQWHLDQFAGFGVQRFVFEQVLGTSMGLFIYFLFAPHPWTRDDDATR